MPAEVFPDAKLTREAYRYIVDLVYRHSRINLGKDKQALLSNRLRHRLRTLKLGSYGDYCQVLQSPSGLEEIEHLIDLVSTNHTRFFREPAHFSFLSQEALPAIVPQLAEDGELLRVWSSACSSGEEPYSLAMVLADFLGVFPAVSWEISATDISRRILAHAEQGIYRNDLVEAVPPDLLKRHFQKGIGRRDGFCRIKKELRRQVIFHRLNLFEKKYSIAKRQNVIFCRNVMIYFDPTSRALLVQRLSEHLAPGGYLIVGHSESLFGIPHQIESVQQGVYRLRP